MRHNDLKFCGQGREQTPLMQCNSCIVEHPAENFGVVPQILLSRVKKLGKVKQLEAS